MARVNITVPDELLEQARCAGLNVSRLASSALVEELDRLARIADLDAYLAELDADHGPPGDQEIAEAREWADQLTGTASVADPRSGVGVTLILNSGGLTALAGRRARLAELRRRGLWPAQVPAVVPAEALTGDRRRDFDTSRLLRACQIRDAGEAVARAAARLRTATGRAGTISAVDAIVTAHAANCPDPIVLTGDPADLTALAANTQHRITVARA